MFLYAVHSISHHDCKNVPNDKDNVLLYIRWEKEENIDSYYIQGH